MNLEETCDIAVVWDSFGEMHTQAASTQKTHYGYGAKSLLKVGETTYE